MHFHLDDTQLALQDAVRGFCADRLGLDRLGQREGRPADPAVWQGLADLGVLGMLVPDGVEGVGIVEAAIAFEELGAHLAGGPLIWSTIGAPLVEGAADGAVRVAGVTGSHPGDVPVVVEHADEADVVLVLHADRVEAVAPTDAGPGSPGTPFDPLTPVTVFDSVPAGRVVGDADAARRLRLQGTILHAASLVGVARGALEQGFGTGSSHAAILGAAVGAEVAG